MKGRSRQSRAPRETAERSDELARDYSYAVKRLHVRQPTLAPRSLVTAFPSGIRNTYSEEMLTSFSRRMP